jgi:hypothetical protein
MTRRARPNPTLLAALLACGSTETGRTIEIAPGEYPLALNATRDALRASGYTVERVDAAAGEVSTMEKTVAGLATPLAPENRAASGLVADTLSNRPRTVRVRFRDASNPDAPPTADGPVRAEVDAIIWRRLNPNWRIETETTAGNTIWIDPLMARRGVTAATPVPLKRDDRFASVIAKRITDRIERARRQRD